VGHLVRHLDSGRQSCVLAGALGLVLFIYLFPALLMAQAPEPTPESERPIPILTGNAGFFTNIEGGKADLVPQINPVILLLEIAGWSKPVANSRASSSAPKAGGPTAGRWNRKSTISRWITSPTAT
jgi:hypothetical protein